MTPDVVVAGPVEGLEHAVILGPCVLGHETRRGGDDPLVLGEGVVIRAFAVLYRGTRLGRGVQIGHGAVVREGNVVEDDCSIGSGAILEPGNHLGPRTRIHSGGFLASTTLGADVFCGPRVVFTDDPHPPCPHYADCVGGAVVGDGVSIGANTTILPGITIGADALIGAGSVVTRPVDAGDVVAGSPARRLGRRDELTCSAGFFERPYEWRDGRVPVAAPAH